MMGVIAANRRRGGGGGGHAYWRLNISQNAGNASFTGIYELEMRSSVGGSNLAAGGTAISGGSDSDGVGNEASKAFDGSNASAWARTSTTSTWLGYHFATPVNVVEIAIYMGASFDWAPRDFTLEYSDDGSTWTVSQTFHGYGWLANAQRVFPEAAPAAGTYRSVRLFISTINGGTRTQLAEMSVAASAGGADQSTGGRAIASLENVGAAASAFDDNTATEWGSFTTTNQYIGYVYPSPVSVAEVKVTGSANTTRSPNTFKIQGSNDDWATSTDLKSLSGVTWTATETKTYSIP